MHKRSSGTSSRQYCVPIILLILTLVLSACGETAVQPSETPVPSSTALVMSTIAPSDTPLPSLTPTRTRTPHPSRTAYPTLTRTLRPATRTPTISATPTLYHTPDSTAVLSTLEGLRTQTDVHVLTSPNGKLDAKLISQVCVQAGEESYIFYQLSLRQVGTDNEQVILQDLGSCGLGAGSYWLTAWSPNSLWLYYTYRVIRDGDWSITNTGTTFRVETASGDSTPLPNSGPLSPDQTRMAWTEGDSLIFYHLDSGDTQTFPHLLPADLPTFLVWKPEGDCLLFVQTEEPSYPFGKSTVGLILLGEMKAQILHEGDDPALIAILGFEPGGVLMGDNRGGNWFLSIPGGKLTQR